jgi:hypothetical protein
MYVVSQRPRPPLTATFPRALCSVAIAHDFLACGHTSPTLPQSFIFLFVLLSVSHSSCFARFRSIPKLFAAVRDAPLLAVRTLPPTPLLALLPISCGLCAVMLLPAINHWLENALFPVPASMMLIKLVQRVRYLKAV